MVDLPFEYQKTIEIIQATVSEDGTKQIQGQVICRAVGSTSAATQENDARFMAYVVQVKEKQSKRYF